MRLPLILLGVLFLLLAKANLQTICTTDRDCPENNPPSFCSGALCMAGFCVPKPSPCAGRCSEYLRACVECETNADCTKWPDEALCDPDTHVCRGCRDSYDCPKGTFCLGGRWSCAGRQCIPPSVMTYPCADPNRCHTETKSCTGCVTDAECGAYDFCKNNKRCDALTRQCTGVNNNAVCQAEGLYCDPVEERCIQCRSDLDCKLRDQSFCEPSLLCNLVTHQCESRPLIDSPCNKGRHIEVCAENRKLCLPQLCTSDAECQDGDSCNGAERCISGLCERPNPDMSRCPEGLYCYGQNCTIPCSDLSDCSEMGYVCEHHSVDGSDEDADDTQFIKMCIPCTTDAQCQNGIAEDGFEVCDRGTGTCQAGIDPCRGAPPGSTYDPHTGLCTISGQNMENPEESPVVLGEDIVAQETVDAQSTALVLPEETGAQWWQITAIVIAVVGLCALFLVVGSGMCWERIKAPAVPPEEDDEEGVVDTDESKVDLEMQMGSESMTRRAVHSPEHAMDRW